MCGGWFLKRVNRTGTRCLDGVVRSRCYVASIRGTAQAPTNGVFLARGRLTAAKLPGFPGYAMLELSQVWSPGSGTAIEPDVVYRVRDNGVRCITAPCFSFDAQLVERARMTRLSDVDLSRARLTPKSDGVRPTHSPPSGFSSRDESSPFPRPAPPEQGALSWLRRSGSKSREPQPRSGRRARPLELRPRRRARARTS